MLNLTMSVGNCIQGSCTENQWSRIPRVTPDVNKLWVSGVSIRANSIKVEGIHINQNEYCFTPVIIIL